MDGVLHKYNICKEYFSFDSNYWSLKFGKAREIKVSNSSETLYYEHLFLEVRRCVLKMCHVLEHWMKYATLCKVKWGQGLSKGRVCTKCYAIQSGGVCDPACEWFLTWMFYREGFLAPHSTPKLEDHPLSVVRDFLFNLFAATLLIGGRSSIRNLRTRHAVVTGTH